MADNQIIIRGLCKFWQQGLLENLDLDIPGKSIAVIGASARQIGPAQMSLGLIEPDAGSIIIDGVETIGSNAVTGRRC